MGGAELQSHSDSNQEGAGPGDGSDAAKFESRVFDRRDRFNFRAPN